jgi:tetratricopeptide (TPR) repeat protein
MSRIVLVFLLFAANAYGQAVTGNEKFDQKQYAEAVAAYEKIPLAERDAGILNRLGISHHFLNQLKAAEAAYRSALRFDPRDAEAGNNLAALYYSQRKFSDAERQIRRSLEQNPENGIIRMNLRAARYARENGKTARYTADSIAKENALLIEKREGDLLQVLILMPQKDLATAKLHETRGDSYFARKMYDDAVIEYRKSITLDRYNASTLNRLGLVYHQSQKLDQAEDAYRDALKQNPFYLEVLNNIGTVEYVRQKYDRAMNQYTKALKIRPQSPTILINMAACLFEMKRHDEAYKAVEAALEIDPKLFDRTAGGFGTLIQTSRRSDPTVYFYYAKVFAAKGDMDRAMSYLNRAVEEGFSEFDKIRSEPAFKALSEDERFLKLMEMAVTPAASTR